MTGHAPIERAAEALRRDNCPCEHLCYCSDWHREAHLAYEAIDTNELAAALGDHQLLAPNGGTATGSWCKCACGHTAETPGTRDHAHDLALQHQALAVKNWLTGKDTQQ